MRLSDRVVCITGGGSGLGRAIVARFLSEGAHVAVLEKSADKVADLKSDLGTDVPLIVGVETCVTRFGRLDVVIGNVGVWDFGTSIDQLPSGEPLVTAFNEIFIVNVASNLFLAHASKRHLKAVRGAMIFTASSAGLHPGGGGPLYTASKHALVGLVRQLAYELAPDVRVNAVAPGGMRSDLRGPVALGLHTRGINDTPLAGIYSRVSPLEALPETDQYVDWYVALASATEATTMTGAVIEADGGERVRGRFASEVARAAAQEELTPQSSHATHSGDFR
jgi:NAD(P)-dependent dehydrogenase (short-subunit alcohol dehydrogenase family)